MAPGNTADVAVPIPIIDRLRHRFGIARVCVLADRGMISGPTIAALEERGPEYVLGVRETGLEIGGALGITNPTERRRGHKNPHSSMRRLRSLPLEREIA